eukprot:TRINITY_DN30650_c0_g1_i1.p1 TRINITY_DN30650_c0_g1~~TRINITY_DN30650_c0_g1_i1.p1  ORF type:complete len:565 (+),score=123.72 TRINITY_DN30650_c0_g1_i1:65-1696(+)
MGCCDSKQSQRPSGSQKPSAPQKKPKPAPPAEERDSTVKDEKRMFCKEKKRASEAANAVPQKTDTPVPYKKEESYDDISDVGCSNSSFTREDRERVRKLSEIPAVPWGQHRDKRRSSKVNAEAITKLLASSPRSKRRKSLSSAAALSEPHSQLDSSYHSEASPPMSDKESIGINLEDIRRESSEASSDDSYIQHRRRQCVDPLYSNFGSLLAPELSDFEKQMHASWSGVWGEAMTLHRQGYLTEAEVKWTQVINLLEKSDDVPSDYICYANCNRCAVLHDDGQYEDAAMILRSCIRPDEGKNSKQLRDIIVHHNLALVLKDLRGPDKVEIEVHSRRAVEGLLQLYGMNRIETLTALSELALVVFEQARLIESFLLARRAREGFLELFGEDHTEVVLAEGRLSEVFEVEQWYSDEDRDKDDAEVLMIKGPLDPMGAQWNGSRLEAVGEGRAADQAGLKRMIGRELRTVNGITVQSLPHLREIMASTCVLILWFDERQPDISDLINATLPSLANIPVTQSVHSFDRTKATNSPVRRRDRRRKQTE